MINTNNYIHTSYRPEIDGLRALAVLSVIIFHFFPNSITGGFIGVDIFFVISGYLISTILFSNLEKNKFDLFEFYDRRVRRIFPALILVLSTSLAFGYFYLLATEYQLLGKHIVGGSTFIANIIFWKENGYFDTSAELKPMLHLWSLAVEEQFYIFWPLMLWIVWNKKLNFLKITLLVATISFLANMYLVNKNVSAAFFLPVSRFWELMIGGALAYISLYRPRYIEKNKNFQSTLGFGLIVSGLIFINKSTSFPGYWAVLPSMGAFFIISAGSDAWLNKTLLANRYAVFIGVISYPLYLWHWPILSFLKITILPDLSATILLCGLILSFILAYLTALLIEKPIRFSKNKTTSPILISVVIIIAAFSLVIKQNKGLEFRKAAVKLDYQSTEEKFIGSRVSNFTCNDLLNLNPVNEEVCLANSKQPRVMFIGDSHVMALHSAVYSNDIKIPSLLISGHSCSLYPNLITIPNDKKTWGNNCQGIANDVLTDLSKISSIKTVVISNFFILGKGKTKFIYYDHDQLLSQNEAFLNGSDFMIKRLTEAGKIVVLVVDPPHLKYDPTQCLKRYSFMNANECRYSEQENTEIRTNYMNLIQDLQKKNPQLIVYDPKSLLCKNGYCQMQDDENYFYNDDDHISIYGSKIILSDMQDKKFL